MIDASVSYAHRFESFTSKIREFDLMKLEPITLQGRFVRLEPLSGAHAEGLGAAVADGELWTIPVTTVPYAEEIPRFIADAMEKYEAGSALPFATIDLATGRVAGSTRYMNISLPDKRLEIGFTFLGKSWQRTPVNTEAKLLMLAHAFEELGLNRVEFKTDLLNLASRAAIQRLGAKEEGILRRHMMMRHGRVRDTVMYSIIEEEWEGVKEELIRKLNR
jgi:RimJ/RimL family protein N-acetyltransferase